MGIDIQRDTYAFSCFITAFNDIDGFDAMPWEQRAIVLSEEYGVEVCERTLRNWCCKLFRDSIASKSSGEKVFWKTECFDGEKYRKAIADDDDIDAMHQYFERRTQIFQAEYIALIESPTDKKADKKKAWEATYKRLWSEFGCCYYSCKAILLSAFSEAVGSETLQEIYELTRELVGNHSMKQEKGKKYGNF